MEVLLLTTLFSIVFAILFLTLFLRDRQVRGFGGVEREALMPLDDGDETLSPPSKPPGLEASAILSSRSSESAPDADVSQPDGEKCDGGSPCQK